MNEGQLRGGLQLVLFFLLQGLLTASSQSLDFSVPPAYRDAIIDQMLKESNKLIHVLNLPEKSPLTRNDLSSEYVTPPVLNRSYDGYPSGNIRTERFAFSFGFGGKLTSVNRLDIFNHSRLSDEELTEQYRKIAITASEVDTNAAWTAMTPYLKAGLFDIPALNRDYQFSIKHMEWGNLHVPKYTASWKKNGKTVAFISLFMIKGTNSFFALQILDPKYNLHQPMSADISSTP
jgi:hypothetical protein